MKKTRKILSSLLALMMLTSVMTSTALATDQHDHSGECSLEATSVIVNINTGEVLSITKIEFQEMSCETKIQLRVVVCCVPNPPTVNGIEYLHTPSTNTNLCMVYSRPVTFCTRCNGKVRVGAATEMGLHNKGAGYMCPF